jgi:hypothetical protein
MAKNDHQAPQDKPVSKVIGRLAPSSYWNLIGRPISCYATFRGWTDRRPMGRWDNVTMP